MDAEGNSDFDSFDSDFDYDDIPLTLDAPKHYEDGSAPAGIFADLGSQIANRGQDEWKPPPTTRGGARPAPFAMPGIGGSAPDTGLPKRLPQTPELSEEPLPSSRHPHPSAFVSAAVALRMGGGPHGAVIGGDIKDDPPPSFRRSMPEPLSLHLSTIPDGQTVDGAGGAPAHALAGGIPLPLREFGSDPVPPSPHGTAASASDGRAAAFAVAPTPRLASIKSLKLPPPLRLEDPASASPVAARSGGAGAAPPPLIPASALTFSGILPQRTGSVAGVIGLRGRDL